MDISNTPPPPLSPDQVSQFTALCAELEDAWEDRDSDRVTEIFERIRQIHPLLSKFMAEGIVEQGFANLSERMGEGDAQAYAIVRDMSARFGPTAT